jgi:diaminopimelate decarboxylase
VTKDLTIYVSGLYSGSNPQPGVGIARSLRQGFPDAKIVGVEYSNRCSGIHWEDLDEVWLQRPWTEIDLDHHAAEIKRRLDDGGYWISSIDLEIMWLAEVFPSGHSNLLTPPMKALDRVSKPAIPAHEGLPVRIPEFVTTELSDWDLHAFCRAHDWKVWLKGPFYEAVRTPTWTDLEHWRRVLTTAWATDKLFLQTHVTGYEESIMLSAYQGELLEAVYMRKRDVTELGKTWAGDVLPVDPFLLEPLERIIRDLNWTGGAELEMIRDADGQLWLLEVNPRFPAWVHGSTIAGHNLPAKLVERASGTAQQVPEMISREFTRVVLEIPVDAAFPLTPLPEPYGGGIGHSLKHPSGLIEFAQRLRDDREFVQPKTNGHGKLPFALSQDVPEAYLKDVRGLNVSSLQTPASVYLENTASATFANARSLVNPFSKPVLTPAYSIKTNPDERLLKLALENGFLAEAISSLEARKAVEAGFRTDQVVLNGPAKWWRRQELPEGELHAIFCDSVTELAQVVSELNSGELNSRTVGVRLRTPNIPSRFGIPIDSPELFSEMIDAVAKLPKDVRFGVHFHMASSNVGVRQWRHLYRSMLRWCGSIEALSGRVIKTLDIGGGWYPDDTSGEKGRIYDEILSAVADSLDGVDEVICEPGKALAQPTFALAMSVLDVRRYSGGQCEVVMDGSIAELPMHFFHPHRILAQDTTGDWRALNRGKSLLLGRLCMEHDIVAANVEVPATAKPGDVYIFCDAGAYDRSMSYVFGCG